MTFGVAIPSYNHAENLRTCLHSVARVCGRRLHEITITDDSGDGRIAREVGSLIPGIQWIIHEKNLGFIAAANAAVLRNRSDIVLLLNDDTELLSDPLPDLEQHFHDENLFAVTFKSVDASGNFREGAKRVVWRLGYPKVLHNPKDQRNEMNGLWASDYAVGGHAAFRREFFQRLGGFDRLFAPFYWEDVDLSMRALARDWKIIYDPKCAVRHAGESAIRTKHNSDFIRETTLRNRILFARRHGKGFNRFLLSLSLAYQKLRDKDFSRAHRAAVVREKEFQ